MDQTSEQLESMIGWYRLMGKQETVQKIVQSLLVVHQFHEHMKEIQSNAGLSQEELREVSQALLNMTPDEEGGVS